VFDYSYGELAAILGKSEANCRQIVSRAEERILERRPRFEAASDESERMTDAFLSACATGDLDGLVKLLADGAVAYSDGGGKVTAARVPVAGPDRIARFLIGVVRKLPADAEVRRVLVNGRPGRMVLSEGQVRTVLTLDIVDGQVANLYIIRNPEKLARVPLD
jgi:RNA polymerase sigma-70 factor (ECF subfamily)